MFKKVHKVKTHASFFFLCRRGFVIKSKTQKNKQNKRQDKNTALCER